MRVLLRLAYLGKSFYGSQKDPHGRTIQGVFEKALERLYKVPVKVTLCSRLDRFVSAYDFALAFTLPDERVSKDHLLYYLRRSLGTEISIRSIQEVGEDFSPRYAASFRSYCYLLQCGEIYNPLYSDLSMIMRESLDIDKLKKAILLMQGEHDFRYLASPEQDDKTFFPVLQCACFKSHGMILFRIIGEHFLRYQVRFMVGLAIRHAEGYITLDEIKRLLAGENLPYSRLKAEGKGLVLEKVCFPTLEEEETYPSGDPAFLF